MKLYPDQIAPVEECIANLKAGKSVLLYAPTGSGKTVMASAIANHFRCKTIFLVNKTVLVSQSYDTLANFENSCAIFHNTIKRNLEGVIMSTDLSANVVVSLVETLENGEIDIDAKLVIIDEAHKATSESYQLFRDKYPNAMFLGLTATPGRHQNKDGEALSEWYDVMVTGDTIRNLISNGRLAKPHYLSFDKDDHVVDTWKDLTALDENKRTIAFVRDARHGLAIKNAFVESGISAEYITAGSELDGIDVTCQTPNQRNEIYKKFRDGEIDVLISFGVLSEGFDEKLAKYCFLLRKVSHIALYQQMVGRVLRAEETKPEGFIVDFCGNIETFGHIEEYIWVLDGDVVSNRTLVKDGSVLYFGHFNRLDKISVVCEECRHVYDVNQEFSCPCCERRNRVKVSVTMAQLKEKFLELVDQDVWTKFCSSKNVKKGQEIPHFLDIVERAIKGQMFGKFNAMYFDLFELDGKFVQEFFWMDLFINNRKLKSTDRVEFVIGE